MIIIHIMFRLNISKIFTDLCRVRQNIEIENAFADIACNVLVVKKY